MLKQIQAIHSEAAMFGWPMSNGELVEQSINHDIELQAAAEIINVVGLAMDSTNIEAMVSDNPDELREACDELVKAASIIRSRVGG